MTDAPVEVSKGRRRAAWTVALGADALQILLLPLFAEGFASPAADALDLAVAGVLWRLLGFHWALLPAAVAELMPVVDLAPTWTGTVLLITGKRSIWIWAAVTVVLIAAVWFAWNRLR